MREKRIFARRTKVLYSNEVKRKYFLVYEGKTTEDIYFEAVNAAKEKLKIDPLIELVPIIRSYSEQNWSNPKKIINRIIKNLQESSSGKISCETLLNCIMEYFIENNCLQSHRISEISIWKILLKIAQENLQMELTTIIDFPNEICAQILCCLAKESGVEQVINELPDIIEKNAITYDKDFDKICFIIDRDKNSFISKPDNNQYAYVLKKCLDNEFGFYISNPCFEFWLLLHFDEVLTLDRNRLLENPKISSSKRYAELELSKLLVGYKKTRYDANFLIEHIDKAIKNEKQFCEDAHQLEYTIGSRVGLLIEELRHPQ